MKKTRVFDSPEDLPKDRSSLLALSNKFGLTFVGLARTFKVYLTQNILDTDKVDGNPNEISKFHHYTLCLHLIVSGHSFFSSLYTSSVFHFILISPFLLVEGIAPLSEVTVDVNLHNLALSCDELTLSVCGMSEDAGLSLTFYDVRTFMNRVIIIVYYLHTQGFEICIWFILDSAA